MSYVAPNQISSDEIVKLLNRKDVVPLDRIDAVLSAIYYGDSIEFAGDVLLEEFAQARYGEKIDLMNLFGTFHQMCTTAYRIDESIALVQKFGEETPANALEIGAAIQELIEFKAMFGGK